MTPLATEREKQRLREQARLDLSVGAEERNRAGLFSTPGPLAEEMVRFCWGWWKKRIRSVHYLEPCVGTGSFYSALLRVFPTEWVERATGYELDPGLAATAHRLWQESGLTVTQGDFLRQPLPQKKYNLIVTNPPYIRHHHLGRHEKERLQGLVRERLGIRISGLAGLYCYFLLLSDAWLEDGGLSVWLIPSEFMDVNYGAAAKEYLTKRVRLLRLHRFCPSDVQFDDALVSSAIVIFEKKKPANGKATFTLGGSLPAPGRSVAFRHDSLHPSDKWTQYTAVRGSLPSRTGRTIPFGDLFTIRRGLATGNNSFFILARTEATRRRLPGQFLRPILPAPRKLPARIIEADPDGFPRLPHQLALLDCRVPEAEVQRTFPDLWRYLEVGKRKGVHEGYLTSRRTPWYSQEDRPPPPFLCTYMGRNGIGRKPFRFLWNQSRATAHNVYLLLDPKGVLQEALRRDPALHAEVFAALESLDTEGFACNGRVYGGGLYKLEPRELAGIEAQFIADRLGLAPELRRYRQRHLFDEPDGPGGGHA
jgi:methylase of polypeptide subunit release factors